MKLQSFKNIDRFIFELNFTNGLHKKVDLEPLIQSKVTLENLKSAHLDRDWGCLEFNDGMVDIDPETLYNFSLKTGQVVSKQ